MKHLFLSALIRTHFPKLSALPAPAPIFRLIVACSILLILAEKASAQNTMVTYQGQLMDGGAPYNGLGQFQFALVTSTNLTHQATATATRTAGFVTSYTVTFGGSGYVTPPIVHVNGGGGSGATATATISGGVVTAINAGNAGNGYTSTPSVIIDAPPANILYTTYWSNDGTSVNGSQPTAAVSVTVSNGLFTVVLGDNTQPNMAAIPAPLFSQPNLQLRIWFDDGVHGSAALDPAQSLTPTPYAVYANTASNLVSGLTVQQNTNGAPNVVGGASVNYASNNVIGATIAGGGATNYNGSFFTNVVTGDFGTVSGGSDNTAGYNANVGGGYRNNANSYYAAIGGGYANTASDYSATVSGGYHNTAAGGGAAVGGGSYNMVTGSGSTVAGGTSNNVSGNSATVAGGIGNIANTGYTTVSGGQKNIASGPNAAVGGGYANTASHYYTTIAGGYANTASGINATVAGGYINTASGVAATVGGGSFNFAGDQATVGGGTNNTADGPESVVSGGQGNHTAGLYATAGGGQGNAAGGSGSTIGGGYQNIANGDYSAVGGGQGNHATGLYSTVAGGFGNTASSIIAFAGGYSANAAHQGAFVWSDYTAGTFSSTANNQFSVRATGGFRFITSTGGAGAQLSANATSWSVISDRNAKKNFAPLDHQLILDKLTQMPIQQWNYKWEADSDVPNIGPMAQDFKGAFYPGRDDKSISTLEFDGVELAAIQGLNEKVEVRSQKAEDRIQQLEAENAELKRQNDSQEKRLDALEKLFKTKIN